MTRIFCRKSVVPPRRISPINEKIIVYIIRDNNLCVLRLCGNLLIVYWKLNIIKTWHIFHPSQKIISEDERNNQLYLSKWIGKTAFYKHMILGSYGIFRGVKAFYQLIFYLKKLSLLPNFH